MALSPQIAAFRSAGVYRLEFDKSQTVAIPAEQLRLVIGFSRKGPFNTPVFCPDTSFFKAVFGDINRVDERKGSFFHRSALAALERGPILALNLWRLNNATDGTGDYDEAYLFSTSSTEANQGLTTEALYSGYFNQDKFWFPSTDSFLTNIGATDNTPFNDLFNLVNLGSKQVTVLVRKAAPENVKGFQIKAQDWYGAANVPSFLNPESFISDFMVDVLLYQGNYGGDATATYPYERFTSDPTFAKYFDKQSGLKRKVSVTDTSDTYVEQFNNLPQVSLISLYTGCLIPGFTDLNGNNLFIEDLINADTPSTGLFCSVNRAMFDLGELIDGVDKGLDLIGHELERVNPKTIDFLSYQATIASDLDYAGDSTGFRSVSLTGVTITPNTDGNYDLLASATSAAAAYNVFRNLKANSTGTVGDFLINADGDLAIPVIDVTVTTSYTLVTVSGTGITLASGTNDPFDGLTTLNYVKVADMNWVSQRDDNGNTGTIIAGPSSQLYSDISDGVLTDGDKAVFGATISASQILYLDFNPLTYGYLVYDLGGTPTRIAISDSDYDVPTFIVNAFADAAFNDLITTDADFGINQTGEFFFDTTDGAYAQGTLGIQSFKGSLNNTVNVLEYSGTPGSSLAANEVIVSADDSTYVAVGKYLLQNVGSSTTPSRLTYIKEVIGISNYTPGVDALKIVCEGQILIRTINNVETVEAYTAITEWVDYYNMFTLDGFELGSYNLPNGTNDQQNNILYDTLSGTKLFQALVDKDNITYRYIVDTFANGIEAGSKAIFFTLAKERQNAFAIVNAPSVENFKKSTDPSFINALGQFDTAYVADGGNLSKNPTVRYTLPGITQGSNYGAFYSPFLTVRENGANIQVPPAGYVSNNYIDKYTTALPWSIVAGNRRGIVGGRGVIGVEYNYSKTDRDEIEPFGLNPIIFQNGTGLVIFANKTAQQNVQSALSAAHVREVMIYIQDGLAAILKNYLFEFNTAQTRLEIKTLADNFMATVQAENGVYNFRNIMDETNNPADVIERNIGILDTFVEPVKGMEILVTRTTILRPGQISSGQV
jgi:hypothetical protein